MPIGDHTHILAASKLGRLVTKLLGTLDLHSHLRISPLLHFLRAIDLGQRDFKVLEVGCGSGTNLFELSKIAPVMAVGYDIDSAAIESAKLMKQRLSFDHLSFHCRDASELAETDKEYDLVLLMDVIEHIVRPKQLLDILDKKLKALGHLIISVPMPVYPWVFGRRFHSEVGHLVDGYRLEDLNGVVPSYYKLIKWRYNTGPLTWPGCVLYYRYVRRIRNHHVRSLFSAALVPFRWLDLLNGDGISASLFAVYQKQ